MARDSSPFSQRLKALAVRAGLPVDAGASARASSEPAQATDDEQPTGEFAAVASAETPAEDQPTGEFPVVPEPPVATAVTGVTDHAAAPEPDASPKSDASPESDASPKSDASPESDTAPEPESELPAVPEPVWSTPGPAPLAPAPPPVRGDGDALPPPPAPIWTDAPPESQTPLAADVTTADGPTLSPPTLSKPAELHEALALPDDANEPAADYVAPTPEPAASTSVETEHSDEQLTVTQPALPSEPAPDPSTSPAASDVEVAASEPETEQPSARERLSLTGRFAALRRRVAPSTDAPDASSSAPTPTDDTPPQAEAPAPAPEPVPVAINATFGQEPAPKPSFSERAALRRRAKTLRARRDTGLLELGAIVLDQRRFGDPTAGALLRRRTDELGDLDNEIASIEHALDDHASAAAVAALGAIRCVSCSALVGPSDHFCANCGTPRPASDAPAAATPADPAS